MSDYHEPPETLSPQTRDAHRALGSLREEAEAVDWYHQRGAECKDPILRGVLAHNRDEEIERACMTLEWLRRVMPGWDEQLRRDLPVLQDDLLEGGALVSTRGGDAELVLGGDFAVGYEHHTAKEFHLDIGESFTFRVLEPAAVARLGLGA